MIRCYFSEERGQYKNHQNRCSLLLQKLGSLTTRSFQSKILIVKLICEGSLLDTMIDRFGTKGVYFGWIDEEHFVCEPIVEINHQFYGWVCGFGESIKIGTPEIAERYANYLKRVTALY